MAGLITVRLSRHDAQPWGFRLQGGKDFGAPLLIQKVNGGSIAEKAGLQVADAVIKVNGQDVYNLRHKDAQDAIIKAGNSFEVVVSRGPGGTWKPNVTPVGNIPAPSPVGGAPAPVTKTSLAYKGPASPAIGTGHNVAARPFAPSPQLNGVLGDQASVKSITSKQYNNPVGLYSEQTIAETLSAQAEVLAGGVLGVNFMKNEKAYTANNSEVLKAVQEIDAEPKTPEPVEPVTPGGGVVSAPPPPVSSFGLRHVSAPETKPPSTSSPQPGLQPGQNICADCERLIVGVFVRIKDKNLHVECFKCATCGTSLKNVGYYNINNKLYCDVHAKLVARSNPPAPNLDPITIPPGGHIPSGALAAPLPSLKPQSPQPGTMAPLPFHAPRMKPSHVSAPRTFKPPTSNISGPKPFGGAAPAPAPFSTPAAPAPFTPAPAPFTPAPAPFTPAPAAPAPAPFSSAPAPPPLSSFPKNLPGQFDPSFTSSQTSHEDTSCTLDKSKRMSVCSTEVSALSEKKAKMKAMGALEEDPSRASPIPFGASDVANESFSSRAVGAVQKSENYETSEQGNVQITRKTKVEESFVRSQKMYTAEISSSGQTERIRAASPELEQIMAKKQISQVYHDSSRLTPNSLMKQNKAQSERCLTPEMENLMEKPHGSWSPMPAACFVRPISPSQTVSYPPDIPQMPTVAPHPRTATPEQFQGARETVERFVDHSKHVNQSHTSTTTRNIQSDTQQSSFAAYTQQYTPRYDGTDGFSQYQGRRDQVDSGNVNVETYEKRQSVDHQASDRNTNNGHAGERNVNSDHQNNSNGKAQNNSNGNHKNQTDGSQDENEPRVTEPDENDEKYSRKSSRADQSQKSSRKTSTDEESSRRVFTDFGGPQVISSVDVESTTEGGVQTTSVRKSEKTNYSSCEFESSRKSFIKQNNENEASSSKEERKPSNTKFSTEGSSIDEEEMVTKSQVEQIIKQELNKVFHMAQTMEQTNFGEMHDYKSQQKHSSEISEQSSKNKYEQRYERTQDKLQIAGEPFTKTGKLTSGLTIAPERPFTPQALESNYPLPYQNIPSDFPPARPHPKQQEPPSKPAYIPLSGDRDSPMLQALTIAPDRPYSPLPTATSVETPAFITAPKSKKSSMLEALTTAPSTPFHLEGCSSTTSVEKSNEVKKTETELRYESSQKYAPRPTTGDFKPITATKTESKVSIISASGTQKSEKDRIKSFLPVTEELKSAFKSSSKVQSSSFAESERLQSESSKQTLQATQQRVERPLTPSGLHAPNYLPYYQQNIGEIPLAHRANSPVPHQIKAPSITPPRAPSVTRQGERRGSVKALSEAYTQQIASQNNQKQQEAAGSSMSSVSYISSGAFTSGSVTKSYSYEQEHKSIDAMGYHASPLAGKLPLAGEQNLPKCSSPVLGKLDHTKQMFRPAIPAQQTVRSFQSPIAEQANLRPAAPYFVQEKEKAQTPWVVVKEKDFEESVNISSFKSSQPAQSTLTSQNTVKPFLPPLPIVNKNQPSKPFSLPGVTIPPLAIPDAGPGGAPKGGATAGTTAPRRGRGVLNTAVGAGGRIPLCGSCNNQIRGPFITALGKIWCPEHFVCVNGQCRRPLQDIGFVEDPQGLYCEFCYEQYLAPTCSKCNAKVKGDCLNAIGKHFHPECFTCAYCGKLFGNNPFFLEDALPYCETDWNELFTTKCFSCGFPIEAGDRWVEALNNNYHSQCFNCTVLNPNVPCLCEFPDCTFKKNEMCKKNLEGQSFFAKGGRPFCKNHAR